MTDPVTDLHLAANGNFASTSGVETYAPGVDGFNLADVSSLDQMNELPSGIEGLVYLGMTDGVTPAFEAAVAQYVGNPKLYGFYVADQPTTAPAANIKAEADYIHAHLPGVKTFLWLQNTSSPQNPVYNLYNPQNTDIDLFGISPQPVRPEFSGGMDLSVIPDAVNAAVTGGIPIADIIPIYQAYGGGGLASTYSLPTASQEQQILSTWGASVAAPAFDFAYSWGVQDGDNAIGNEPSLQQVFAAHNGVATSSPPMPVFTTPANGSAVTTTATPVIAGNGIPGDTVTLSIDGTNVSSAIAIGSDDTWTFTPTAALANGAHMLTATEIAPDGSASTAASDTLTVNVADTPPAPPTITAPASGSIDMTTAEPLIAGTGVSGDAATIIIDGSIVGTAAIANGAWSYTPTTPLTDGSHTVTATQAASGGASSASSTPDTFNVTFGSGGGGQTISTAVSGQLYLTAASNPLTITSAGSITNATGGDAISGPSGTAWQISNAGSVSGVASASSAGVYTVAAGISVQNTGKISGSVAGLWLADGGMISNAAAGTISAAGDYGVYVSGAAATVTNFGKITGATYAVDLTFSSTSNRVVVGPDATFTGTVAGGNGTLDLTSGADFGALAGLNSGGTYTGFSALVVDAGAIWTLGGTNTVSIVTDQGTLVIAGDLPAASYQIGAVGGGGTLEVATAPGTASPIRFLGASKLIVDSASAFGSGSGGAGYTGPLLKGFSAGDTIDIKNLSATNASLAYNPATGLLQIANGQDTATLAFQASTLGSGSFALASDGAAGVNVILSQTPSPAAPTITSPAKGSVDTTTAKPVISGTGINGDTVSVSIDGALVGTAPVANGAWSFTPSTALTNASHTVTATQAAAGGPSSAPSATDIFTVNVSGGLIISTTTTGPLTLSANNNPVTITSMGSVKATGSGSDAIDGPAGARWSVTNAGTILSSQAYGISLKGAGSSIVNSGTIAGNTAASGYGVALENGGTVSNASSGTISGGEDAIFVYGAAGTITNNGTISSSYDDGIGLFGGGSVINNAGGVIKAPTGGGYGPAAIYIPSGSASVVNSGSINGQYGIYYGVAGTIENAGSISGTSYAVDFAASSSANRLIVDPGAVFTGGVFGGGGRGAAAGTGSIGQIGSSAFGDFTSLADDANAFWTLTGANTIASVLIDGSVSIAGSLDVTSTVAAASVGQFALQSGGSLEVAADAATHSTIDFLGSAQLTIDNVATFGTGVGGSSYAGPLLKDFGPGDKIDLHNFGSIASMLYDSNTGLLYVGNSSNQFATLDFQNFTLGTGAGFTTASDGKGGVLLMHG